MGMANLIDNPQLLTDITIAIDKVDKIGIDKAMEDLALKGLNEESVLKIQNIIKLKGNNETKIKQLKRIFVNYTEAIQGIEELEMILKYNEYQSLSCPVILDLSLARGLNYYTGTIIEIKATQVNIGSISGGGRYDNLTGIFGLPDISGVGISFGADRIADVMNELSLFPSYTETSTKIMFVNFGKKEELFCIQKLKQLREHGICCELYPDNVKIKKQMSYANARKIPYVVLAGESEINNTNGKLTVKDMSTGTEKLMTTDEIIKMISDNQNKL
jgi:histidyl-tRNA synthetase